MEEWSVITAVMRKKYRRNVRSAALKYISGFKAGTQKIEEIVKKRFPGARVLRMDFDTTRNKDSYEKILSAFANQEADVLIGTQMIVKGHDFPNVTLVGVIWQQICPCMSVIIMLRSVPFS